MDSEETSLLPEDGVGEVIVGDADCPFNKIIEIIDPGSSAELVKKWTDFARSLNIKEETINTERTSLLMETKQITDVYSTMLMEWRSVNGNDATLHSLEELLRNNGFQKASDRLCGHYNELFADLNKKIKTKQQTRLASAVMLATFVLASATAIISIELERSIQALPRNSILNLPDEYISRELGSRRDMSSDTLFNGDIGDNVLVFSSIDQYRVQQLVKFGSTVSVATTLHDGIIKSRYITGLLLVTEFYQICEIRDELSVHWLQYNDNSKTFKWMDSCGKDMSFIQRAVDVTDERIQEDYFGTLPFFPKLQHKFNEKMNDVKEDTKFSNNFIRQPVIIYGSSGSGKSTLLASIGHSIQTHATNVTVVLASFAPFVMEVTKQNKRYIHLTDSVLSVIVKIACENGKCRNHLTEWLQAGKCNLLLLLDGFDQLPNEQIEYGLTILNEIKNWNSTLFFITTRPNYLIDLENLLNTMGYGIEPFSTEKQIEYLVKVWNKTNQNLDIGLLQNYSKSCVTEIKSRLSEKEQDFTGIALLTSFMAVVYEQNASLYEDPNIHIAPGDPKIYFSSVFQLYDQMAHKLISRYTNDITTIHRMHILHSYEAIRIMFPDMIIDDDQSHTDELLKSKIMEMSSDGSGRLQFIHPTFADYFVSWYSINCTPSAMLCQTVKEKVLMVKEIDHYYNCNAHVFRLTTYTFSYNLVAYFLNASPSRSKADAMVTYLDSPIDLLAAAVHDDYESLFETVYESSMNSTPNHITTEEFEKLVVNTIIHSSMPLVTSVLEKIPEISKKPLHDIKLDTGSDYCPSLNLINLAAMRGVYEIFNHLWPFIKDQPTQQYLVHCAAIAPFEYDGNVNINEKKAILGFLVNTFGASILDTSYEGYYSCTPIFYTYSKEIIHELLMLKADAQIICPSHGTLLHYLSNYKLSLSPDDYEQILARLDIEDQLTPKIVNYYYGDMGTPLQNYVSNFEIERNVLELFKWVHADFLCRTENETIGESTLFSTAIAAGRRPDSLKVLMPYAPYWQNSNFQNDTALTVAIRNIHYSAAELFISLNPDHVKIRDRNGNTPLFSVFVYPGLNYKDIRQMVKLLIKNGSDPNAQNGKDDGTPFLMAVQMVDLATVKFLANYGADMKYKDANNNTALHYALNAFVTTGDEQYGIVKYLVTDGGIEVNSRNARNMTALEECIDQNFHPIMDGKTITFLIGYGAVTTPDFGNKILDSILKCQILSSDDPTLFNEAADSVVGAGANLKYEYDDGSTFLHAAVQFMCPNAVLYLIESGLDLLARNNKGITPVSFVDESYIRVRDGNIVCKILQQYVLHMPIKCMD